MPKPTLRLGACVLVSLLVATPAATAEAQQELPVVDSSTIWVGTVQRGEFVRQVRAPGALERFGRGMHAHVRVAGEQATAIALDQNATVDAYGESLAGRVAHIEDRVVDGTVAVIVEITDDLPPGLRPGSDVHVKIDVETLADAVWVERPAFARSDQMAGIFKLLGEEGLAERVAVRWGSASVDKIVVVDGLEVGDRIILSDMSRYDSSARVRVVS